MNQTPIRNLLFLCALLFIILSSGSLQCALNCYEHTAEKSDLQERVTDCHPLANEDVVTTQAATFCHRNHAQSQAASDPILSQLNGVPTLALLNVRVDVPACRSSESLELRQIHVSPHQNLTATILPVDQNQKQIRSTILLM